MLYCRKCLHTISQWAQIKTVFYHNAIFNSFRYDYQIDMSQKHDLHLTWKMTFHKSASNPVYIWKEEPRCIPSTQYSQPHSSMFTLISLSCLHCFSESLCQITLSYVSWFPQWNENISLCSSASLDFYLWQCSFKI